MYSRELYVLQCIDYFYYVIDQLRDIFVIFSQILVCAHDRMFSREFPSRFNGLKFETQKYFPPGQTV